jgi:predicted small metal-binding protein
MSRVMADCRRFESENDCTLTIIGDEAEVVPVAVQHAVDAHGHEDTPELREGIRKTLEPAEEYDPGERQPEPFPG